MSSEKYNWSNFYKDFSNKEPSSFAKWAVASGIILPEHSVLDIGCGNGRDSLFFAEKGSSVTGVDSADVSPEGITFIRKDIADYIIECPCDADILYSRFFFHSIDSATLQSILDWCSCRLVAEFRIIGDTPVLYPDHKRYPVDMSLLEKILVERKYGIEYIASGRGLAVYNGEDPLIGRVVATRKSRRSTLKPGKV